VRTPAPDGARATEAEAVTHVGLGDIRDHRFTLAHIGDGFQPGEPGDAIRRPPSAASSRPPDLSPGDAQPSGEVRVVRGVTHAVPLATAWVTR
jgi:hypothetical protein